MTLSSAELAHYREHGYVVLRGVLEPREIDRYLVRLREVALGDHPPGAASRVMRDIHFAKKLLAPPADPEQALWKVMNPDRFDACLAECLRIPRLVEAVASIVGEDVLAFLLQFIYKPPRVPESIHPFHQDGVFFAFEPQERVVGAWLPLDPVGADNGSLSVVPGTHRLAVGGHEQVAGVNKNSIAVKGAEGDPELLARAVTFELPPGDCVLFHPHLYHRTGGNRTDGHRRVITVHFASAECRATSDYVLREFGFTSVRGRIFPGCLQPLADPDLGFRV